jgi:hypothetical protein
VKLVKRMSVKTKNVKERKNDVDFVKLSSFFGKIERYFYTKHVNAVRKKQGR